MKINLFDPDGTGSRCDWRDRMPGDATVEGLAVAGAKVAVPPRRLFDEKN
jgi:hypothetical protein